MGEDIRSNPKTHPAIKFCERIAKRASDEGWELMLHPSVYIWRKKEDDSTATGCNPIMMPYHPDLRVHMMEFFHEACCHLERHLGWKEEVVL